MKEYGHECITCMMSCRCDLTCWVTSPTPFHNNEFKDRSFSTLIHLITERCILLNALISNVELHGSAQVYETSQLRTKKIPGRRWHFAVIT